MAHCSVQLARRCTRPNSAPKPMALCGVLYAARIGDCRACPLREQCQWHGEADEKAASGQSAAASTPGGLCSPALAGLESQRASPRLHAAACATNGWTSTLEPALPGSRQTRRRLRSFLERSVRITASRWHERLARNARDCNGWSAYHHPVRRARCLRRLPRPAYPAVALLLLRREAALLGKDFLSERMLMPSLPDCSSVSLFCCSFCSLCRCVSHLSQQNVRLWATFTHSLRD